MENVPVDATVAIYRKVVDYGQLEQVVGEFRSGKKAFHIPSVRTENTALEIAERLMTKTADEIRY